MTSAYLASELADAVTTISAAELKVPDDVQRIVDSVAALTAVTFGETDIDERQVADTMAVAKTATAAVQAFAKACQAAAIVRDQHRSAQDVAHRLAKIGHARLLAHADDLIRGYAPRVEEAAKVLADAIDRGDIDATAEQVLGNPDATARHARIADARQAITKGVDLLSVLVPGYAAETYGIAYLIDVDTIKPLRRERMGDGVTAGVFTVTELDELNGLDVDDIIRRGYKITLHTQDEAAAVLASHQQAESNYGNVPFVGQ